MDTGDERFLMWISVIPYYEQMDKAARRKAKTAYAKSLGFDKFGEVPLNDAGHTHTLSIPSTSFGELKMVSFDDCPKATVPCPTINLGKASSKKKGTNMYDYDMDCEVTTETERTKSHLEHRLGNVFHSKDYDLVKAFNLREDSPDNDEDLVKRITEGRYELKETQCSYSGRKFKKIVWRDPKAPADRDGYDAASKKLSAAYTAAQDELKVYSPEKGLESLRAFESTTFH